jgi:Arc/MetJ family transcription regulator
LSADDRIEVDARAGGVKLRANLRNGARAYVDADWISAGSPSVAAIVTDGGSSSTDADDRAAGLALLAIAVRLADELAAFPAERIELTGTGFVAGALRRLLGTAVGSDVGARPSAVVETTGDPQRLLDATRRVDDLGTVFLGGEVGDRRVQLDLYQDVHLRGLEVVGIPPARLDAPPREVPRAALDYLESEPPAYVTAGEPLPRAAWYRLS